MAFLSLQEYFFLLFPVAEFDSSVSEDGTFRLRMHVCGEFRTIILSEQYLVDAIDDFRAAGESFAEKMRLGVHADAEYDYECWRTDPIIIAST
jgi:hypothetical protein